MAERDRMRYPLKGDLLVKLRMTDGTVTVLIEREKVKPHHIAAMKKLGDVLTNELMRAEPAFSDDGGRSWRSDG